MCNTQPLLGAEAEAEGDVPAATAGKPQTRKGRDMKDDRRSVVRCYGRLGDSQRDGADTNRKWKRGGVVGPSRCPALVPIVPKTVATYETGALKVTSF